MKILSVIMAGGCGSRLWPLSTTNLPKQFIEINNGLSLFQLTVLRNKNFGDLCVITNEIYYEIAYKQILAINSTAIFIVEPYSRNTMTPAVAATILAQQLNYTIIILIPSDAAINDIVAYKENITTAILSSTNSIVTIGIKPLYASCSYGYIKIYESGGNVHDAYKVESFIEKPAAIIAESYISDNRYFWNAGIFVCDVGFFANHIYENHRDQYESMEKCMIYDSYNKPSIILYKIDQQYYSSIKSTSLDYAVMETVNNMLMIIADFDWSDVGSWDSLWTIKQKDINNNYVNGDAILYNVSDSYISSSERRLVVVDIKDVVVIISDAYILLASKNSSENIKKAVQRLRVIDKLKDMRNKRLTLLNRPPLK